MRESEAFKDGAGFVRKLAAAFLLFLFGKCGPAFRRRSFVMLGLGRRGSGRFWGFRRHGSIFCEGGRRVCPATLAAALRVVPFRLGSAKFFRALAAWAGLAVALHFTFLPDFAWRGNLLAFRRENYAAHHIVVGIVIGIELGLGVVVVG